MANYNVTVKMLRGARGVIEPKIQQYLNSLDSSKIIRSICAVMEGAEVTVIIIHDA